MDAETLVRIGGVFHLLVAAGHLAFWKALRWKDELAKLTSLNRAIVQLLNLSLTLAFLLFAFLCLVHSHDLVSTSLGGRILLLLSAFWYLRAVQQVLLMGLRKRYSVALTALFLAAGTLYALALADT